MRRDASPDAHQNFYERFCSFWSDPSADRVREIIAPDATIHFTGQPTMSGTEYYRWMGDTLAGLTDLRVEPGGYAGNEDRLYISWEATATIEGTPRRWFGVDRFRLQDGMAIEEHIIFDSALLEGPKPNA